MFVVAPLLHSIGVMLVVINIPLLHFDTYLCVIGSCKLGWIAFNIFNGLFF